MHFLVNGLHQLPTGQPQSELQRARDTSATSSPASVTNDSFSTSTVQLAAATAVIASAIALWIARIIM
jgi:hypothetical protein